MLRTPARDVHVHVFPPDSPEVERCLLFRDRLRTVAEERELYAATKRRLAEQDWPTMQYYAEAKTEMVEAILRRAVAARDAAEHATWYPGRGHRSGRRRALIGVTPERAGGWTDRGGTPPAPSGVTPAAAP